MKQNDPELLAKSAFSAFPKGPKLQIDSQSPNVRAIPTSSKQQEAARQLIDYLANDAYSAPYFAEAMYGPVLNDQQKLPGVWSDPIHAGLLDLALPRVLVATVWRGLPFWVISFLAALQTVPEERYDAAKTDGATAWQRFQYVTLPSIRHVVLVVVLLSTIWTANSFDNVWLMTQGGPADATMILPVLAYFGMTSFQLGQAAAVMVLPLPIFAVLIVVVANLLQRA